MMVARTDPTDTRLKWVVFYFVEGVVTYRCNDREWSARVTGHPESKIVIQNNPLYSIGRTGAQKVMALAVNKLVKQKRKR